MMGAEDSILFGGSLTLTFLMVMVFAVAFVLLAVLLIPPAQRYSRRQRMNRRKQHVITSKSDGLSPDQH